MGRTDWTAVTGGLAIGSQVEVEPTGGLGTSPAGGSFVLGARAQGENIGSWAMYTDQADFIPAARGGSVSALLRAGYGNSPAASPFVFVCGRGTESDPGVFDQPPNMTSPSYALGLLVDGSGVRVVLAKSTIGAPLPSSAVGVGGVIARGSDLGAVAAWRHLRLTAVWNPRRDPLSPISTANGDVALRVEENDLSVGTLELPVWKQVPGMPLWTVDDALGAATGTPPLEGGFFGIGAVHGVAASLASFKRVAAHRQA
jgi:hypothetical protein